MSNIDHPYILHTRLVKAFNEVINSIEKELDIEFTLDNIVVGLSGVLLKCAVDHKISFEELQEYQKLTYKTFMEKLGPSTRFN